MFSDDDGSSGSASGFAVDAQAGVVYRLAVDGKATASGALTFNWMLRRAQSIVFASIGKQPVGASIVLPATASSGLAVTFASLTPAVCAVNDSIATMVTTGLCSIAATQAGKADCCLAVPDAVQGFNVYPVVTGVCGPTHGQSFLGASTSDLCSAGMVSSVSGSGPWMWTCEGAGGGSSAA